MIDKKLMATMLEMGIEADKVLALFLAQDEPEEPEKPKELKKPEEPEKPEELKKPEEEKDYDPVMAAINRLTGMVQAGALRRGPESGTEETTEQIFARVLTGVDRNKKKED